jgi:2-furoyl-CoA dehydrogenase large subunit
MSAGIQASEFFHVASSAPPTDDDRVNSSHAYGFVAEVIAVEVDPITWGVTILKYASAGDAGTIINPKLVEGQTYGSALHGLGGALLEEFRWDEDGQFLTGTFADYRCLTAAEAPRIETRRDARTFAVSNANPIALTPPASTPTEMLDRGVRTCVHAYSA